MWWERLFREGARLLRSRATDRQIALGGVLGFLLAAIPGLSAIHVLLVAAVLILDASLRGALLALSVAALLLPRCDPVFHAAGSFLLEDVGWLVPLWTAVDATPIGPLTGFTNTVTAGSVTVGLLIAPLLYRALRTALPKLRRAFPRSGTPPPGHEDDNREERRQSWRRRAVLFAGITSLIVLLIAPLLLHPVVESAVERALSRATSTRVDVSGLSLTIAPPGLRWDRLIALDSSGAGVLACTGRLRVGFAAGPLLRGRFVADSLFIEDVRLVPPGEPGAPAGVTVDAPMGAPLQALARERRLLAERFLVLRRPLHGITLRSPGAADSLLGALPGCRLQVDRAVGGVRAALVQAAAAESALQEIDGRLLRTPGGVFAAVRTIAEAVDAARELVDAASRAGDSLGPIAAQIAGGIARVHAAGEADLAVIRDAAGSADIDAGGAGILLLSDDLGAPVARAWAWPVRLIRWIAGGEEAPEPERLRGKDVRFGRPLPRLWVKHVRFDGALASRGGSPPFTLAGTLEDLSSCQRRAGVPTAFRLAVAWGPSVCSADGVVDRRGDVPRDELRLSLDRLALPAIPLGDASLATVVAERCILGGALLLRSGPSGGTADLRLRLDSLSVRPGEGNPIVAAAGAAILRRAGSMEARLHFDGTVLPPLRVRTTVDGAWEEILRDAATAALREAVTVRKGEVVAAVERAENGRRTALAAARRMLRETESLLPALRRLTEAKREMLRLSLAGAAPAG